MTHLHIRVPTKTRLHELKMAWFFRNSLGSIFDDYSEFILFNKICSETNYISEHDINTLFRPPCLGRNLLRGGGPKYKNPTYVGKFCEKCPHYVPSDWVWAPKEKTFSSRSWRTDQEWVMTKSRIISRLAWSNSVDKYSLWNWPLCLNLKIWRGYRLEKSARRTTSKRILQWQLFLNSFGSRRKPHNSSKNEAYFHITTLLYVHHRNWYS